MHGQYQLPTTLEHAQQLAPEFTGRIEYETTAEAIDRSFYETAVRTGLEIEAMRLAADETTIPRYRLSRIFESVTRRFVVNRAPAPLMTRLIDAESEIGASLLPLPNGKKSHRFWYHEGDWFYETVDALGPMVARYTVGEKGIEKLVDGSPVQLHDGDPGQMGEEERLLVMIGLYREEIERQLYKRDVA
ncbi:MAG TPA: hypothetical protein QF549_03485 [Candidatus Saccharimonadaceae bacterium]|nr:hypothetical protein [Candidatus Saccharimonadaceae bacterium]|tara:strand:- start:2669 stop:3235 length:567 start_codon:yes stop_codon:yes gene_type:complete